MKQKYLYFIVAGLIISVLAIITFANIRSAMLSRQANVSGAVSQVTPVVSEESMAPSIEDIKDRPSQESRLSKKEPTSLAQVYSQYPKEDTGGNMVASWAKVSPEEKARVYEQLDQEIASAQEALKVNPADKKAKHILFISETLKKICKSNFDYSLLETVPQDQGGFKPRSKK